MQAFGASFEWLFAAVLMLGVLVTVHEFGHFAVAKLCGVRVLRFSVGFGSPLGIGRHRLAWTRGGTEYAIGWLPLGGYVKMLGESIDGETDPEVEADRAHSLGAQPLWKKLAIVFAGPGMNLLLPVVVLMGFLFAGVDRREAVIGALEPGSPAVAAGLEAGDRVVAVDGEPIRWWDELDERVRASAGETLDLRVDRDGKQLDRRVGVVERAGLDVFHLSQPQGWIGAGHARPKAMLGVVSSTSPAARAGLRSGDLVVAVDGEAVLDWNDFARHLAKAGGGPLALTVERGEGDAAHRETVRLPAAADPAQLGVIPAVVLVEEVSPGMPAERAGLAPGDLIVAVDGAHLGSFFDFQETVRASKGRPLRIEYARGGENRVVTVAPEKTEIGDGGVEEAWLIGIRPADAMLPGAIAEDQVRNPFVALPRAVAMTADLTRSFLAGLGKILSGELSRRSVGGPIEIARQSQLALRAGWDVFLQLMIMISINLAILNLLPIPILDGGMALMFAVESVRRTPLPQRAREAVQQVGLLVIVALMGFAFWNDLSRHWETFLQWVRGL